MSCELPCVRAFVHAYMRACVRANVRTCVCTCVDRIPLVITSSINGCVINWWSVNAVFCYLLLRTHKHTVHLTPLSSHILRLDFRSNTVASHGDSMIS